MFHRLPLLSVEIGDKESPGQVVGAFFLLKPVISPIAFFTIVIYILNATSD